MQLASLKFGAERPDTKSQFNSILYQLLLDPSERVCFEAILCVLGKADSAERYVHIAAVIKLIFKNTFILLCVS